MTRASERERAAIDAGILALANGAEYQAMDRQLAKEFETSDREVWAMLDKEFGPDPPEEPETK